MNNEYKGFNLNSLSASVAAEEANARHKKTKSFVHRNNVMTNTDQDGRKMHQRNRSMNVHK